MRTRPTPPVVLTAEERETLEQRARRPTTAQALAQRARIVLASLRKYLDTLLRQHVVRALLIVVAPLVPLACAQATRPADPETSRRWLGYLQDGKTTKEEALLKLGLPSAQFEGERILSWRLMLHASDGLVPVAREVDPFDPRMAQWREAEYNLILVFDQRNVMQRHSLIKIK